MQVKTISRQYGIISLFILMLIVLFSYANQNLITPNLNSILVDFFGTSTNSTPLGTLSLVVTLVSAISMVGFGLSTDKYSRKWICFGGSLVFSIFSILSYFTPSGSNGFSYFFFVQVMNGIGLGCVVPTIFSLIGDFVTTKNRSKALSGFSIAGLLGQGVGIIVASSVGYWRLSFLIIGITNLICTLLIPAVKEPVRGRTDDLIADLVAQGKVYSYTIKRQDLRVVFERKSNLWLIVNFVDTVPTGIILFLLFRYMEIVHNVGQGATTTVLIGGLVGGLFGNAVFGIISDHYFKKSRRARVWFAFAGNIFPIPFIFFAFILPFRAPDGATIMEIFAIPQLVVFMLLVSIGLFLNGSVGPNWYSTLMDVNLPEHRGTVVAAANFFDLAGRALGPFLGSLFDTAFGPEIGILSSVIFWIALPFFWIGVLKNVAKDMNSVKVILQRRRDELIHQK